ncbi:MAG: hypothetical protein GY751_02085 [Bacteroidetes bacterium]|nr:hypothetical protein [Bacteroidota bacterium]
MNIKIIGSLLLLLFFCRVYPSSDIADQIKLVNNEVSNIEIDIKENRNISTFNFKYSGMFHGSGPGVIKFYSLYQHEKKSFTLVCVKFIIAKEFYRNEYSYYFCKDEKLIKFSMETIGRPDNPPKRAIIFDLNGRPLWSNFKHDLPIKKEDLKRIFKEFNKKMFDLTRKHGKLM